MNKKFVLTVMVAALSFFYAKGQNNTINNRNAGVAFELGASVNYYYGMPDQNFDKFQNDRLNWQLNAMLGITIARDKAERRSMIAAFGSFGFNNNFTIAHLLQDQQYTTTATNQATANNFYQVEGGLLILDMFRVSTGMGQQNFNAQPLVYSNGVLLNATNLKYNSSTVGVKLNIGPVAWTLNCNFAYGQDFNKTVISPDSGLMFRF